jgi:D-serine dehydratase
MSADAKEWKKNLLRKRGVEVIEYSSDYSRAVEEGRRQSQADPSSHFVDDENSKDLFLGYSVAALRLKKQLEDLGIVTDGEHPLNVYLPCGVGGAPGGITFGLKHVFGDNARCYFAEPTHSPCMLLGLMTGEHERISVGDFGIDNITDADGLAVGRSSGLVGRLLERLINGVFTVDDNGLYEFLALLKDSEGIRVEPSAAAGFAGPLQLQRFKDSNGDDGASHIVWATGGLFVPETQMDAFYKKGKELLNKR